jgi:ABC-2 type transport system ATP-binding protein
MDSPHIRLVDVRKTFTLRRNRGLVRRERVVVHAVDGITMDVARGELCGYIGPNGAGKSTTIKMLTGILVPTSGTVEVAGRDPSRSRVALARRIGVVFGQRTQLWWDLPLADSFALLRHLYRVPAQRHAATLATLVERLDVGAFLGTPVRQLSLGQRMRGELVAAMLHEPEILYLDEPTIGLDVVSKAAVRDFLLDVNTQRGVTILLTTHDLADIERLSTRIVVIDRGRVISDGTVADLKRRFGDQRTVVVDLAEPSELRPIPAAEIIRAEGPRRWVRFRPDETTAAAVIAAIAAQAPIRDLMVEEPAIDDVVRRIYAAGAE